MIHLRQRFEQTADVLTDVEQRVVEQVNVTKDQLNVAASEEHASVRLGRVDRILFDVRRRCDVREVILRLRPDVLPGSVGDRLGTEHALIDEDVWREANGFSHLDANEIALRAAVDVLADLAALKADRTTHWPARRRTLVGRTAAGNDGERARAVRAATPRRRDLDRRLLQFVQLIERLNEQTDVALDIVHGLVEEIEVAKDEFGNS